jgi:competence protein ComGC
MGGMKTILSKQAGSDGFTLTDLLVMVGVIALLVIIQLPAVATNKSQSKIAVCADHVRQLGLASQIYANDNNGRLPYIPLAPGSWAWDTPTFVTTALLKSGAQTNTFYCPGTGFTDQLNWLNPDTRSLWSFAAVNDTYGFRMVGYVLAFQSNPALNSTNLNKTILPETIVTSDLTLPPPPASERVLVADSNLSNGRALPGYLHPENKYTNINSGFWKAVTSAHMDGVVPAGGNLGFKDGHVDWRKFELMRPQTSSGMNFWW